MSQKGFVRPSEESGSVLGGNCRKRARRIFGAEGRPLGGSRLTRGFSGFREEHIENAEEGSARRPVWEPIFRGLRDLEGAMMNPRPGSQRLPGRIVQAEVFTAPTELL